MKLKGGVLAKHKRKKKHLGKAFTYYGREDRCAICDITCEEAGYPDAWAWHYNGRLGTVIVAETCSDAHSQEFDVFHREEVEREWEPITAQLGRNRV